MKIGEVEVILPIEDPLSARADWRRAAAEAMAAISRKGRIPGSLDNTVKAHLRFLRSAPATKLTEAMASHERVTRWADGDRGILVKACLLAGMSDDEVATELGVEPSDVTLFRSLVFDVFDSTGKLRPDMRQDIDAETAELAPDQQVMMRAALLGGADLLRMVLTTGNVESEKEGRHLQQAVERELIIRVLRGDASNSDLARLANHGIAKRRMLHETGESKSTAFEGAQIALDMLKLTAPHMVPPELKTDEAKASADASIRSKLAAEKEIGKHPLEHVGGGDAAINEMLRNKTNSAAR